MTPLFFPLIYYHNYIKYMHICILLLKISKEVNVTKTVFHVTFEGEAYKNLQGNRIGMK